LRQLDPIQGNEPRDLGEADRDDHEVGAAHFEGQAADRITAQSGDDHADEQADDGGPRLVHHAKSEHVHVEPERRQRAGIGADAEERHVTEAELPGIAEQQVQAHRRNDENAGRDQDVQDVLVLQPQRNGEENEEPDRRQRALHPTRSARANSPVGLNNSTTMMIKKPIASR
jgi:hypothetical protein